MKKPVRVGLINTAKDFTQNSSVHGIGYIFNNTIPLADSIIWAFLSLGSLSLAIYMSVDTYLEWQAKPTIITLTNSSVPATEITFPAVTICRDGIDMKVVEDAIVKDFTKWKRDNHRTSGSKQEDEDLLHQYMEETYKLKTNRNIFDLVKAHLSPDSSESSANSAILENLKACEKTDADKRQKKRSIETSDPNKKEARREKRSTNEVTFLLSDMGNQYYKVQVDTSGNSLSPELVNSACQDVGMLPVCSNKASSSETCMSTYVNQTTFANRICDGTTKTSCQGPSNTFLFSEERAACLEEALEASGICDTSSQALQASFVLCVTPAGKCHT